MTPRPPTCGVLPQSPEYAKALTVDETTAPAVLDVGDDDDR